MLRSVFTVVLMLAFAAPLSFAEQAAVEAVSPSAEVEEATGRHIEVLSGLIDKVPEDVRARIEKAMEVSRRGGEKALEALARVELGGVEVGELTNGSQVKGIEKALASVKQASERAVVTLEDVLSRVPEEAFQAIEGAIERIRETREAVTARLAGLLERGVSTAHPPERPARPDAARPADVRPARPDLPTQIVRPEVARPARPETPPRPDGRP